MPDAQRLALDARREYAYSAVQYCTVLYTESEESRTKESGSLDNTVPSPESQTAGPTAGHMQRLDAPHGADCFWQRQARYEKSIIAEYLLP